MTGEEDGTNLGFPSYNMGKVAGWRRTNGLQQGGRDLTVFNAQPGSGRGQKAPGMGESKVSRDLTELDVAESILNAVAIYKRLRSGSPRRVRAREYLYIIQSTNLAGLPIYTKGKLVKEPNQESYYFLVSSKRAL